MSNDQHNLITKMFEYNKWANVELIKVCSTLDEKQLEVETVGVMGRIHPTLVHLVRAEGGYLNRLVGSRPWSDDLDWDNMPMSDLLANAELAGQKLIDIAAKADPSVKHDVEFEGKMYFFFNWTVLTQTIYHGIEHRTQIKALLTKLDVPHPELAAWDFTDALFGQ